MMRIVGLSAVALGLASLSPEPVTGTAHPRVAIVFEHAGASLDDLQPIYAMRQPLGLGIFPHQRYSAQIVREAFAHGLAPILHLSARTAATGDLGPVTGVVWIRMAAGVRSVLITTYLGRPADRHRREGTCPVGRAVRRGWAVAGAHITTGAPEIVARHLGGFRDAGVVFVPITEFVTEGRR